MNAIIKYVIERLSERTTWIGLLGAISMAVNLTVEQLEAVGTLGVAVASAVLIFFKDKLIAPPKDEPTA